MHKNETVCVKIEDMSNLGYGIARTDGKVTFVSGAADGDTAEIKIIKTSQNYNVARLEKIVGPSPHRTEPGCRVFSRCGGCSFRNITYAHEKELKRGFIESAMRKNRVDIEVADVRSDGNISGWRNKVEYPVSGGRFGCYARHSHDVTALPETGCCIQDKAFDPITAFLSGAAGKVSGLRHIYLRRAAGTGEIMLCFVTGSNGVVSRGLVDGITREFPEIVSVAQNFNDSDGNVILGGKTVILRGRETICDVLCGLRFNMSPESFYQVNHGMAEMMYRRASELLGLSPGQRLIDLFCGIGTIGLTIAASSPGIGLTGVEICPPAAENAAANARLNGIEADFVQGDANLVGDIEADAIVVDPPRKGIGPELASLLCDKGPEKLLYISCNPETLARDLSILGKAYKWEKAEPFDLFPRTGHVETVCLLYHQKDKFISVPYEPKDAEYLKRI